VGIVIPAFFQSILGSYFPCLYLDTVPGVSAGREIWGFPKQDGEITITQKKGAISARVSRYGAVIARASVEAAEPIKPPGEETNSLLFNHKLIPSAKKNNPPEVNQLTSARCRTNTREP